MSSTLVFVNLAGAVALLLWGVHMVETGFQRAFGPNLRRVLATMLTNRFQAMGAGLAVTAVLQGSTATALVISSFTASGLVALVPALAVMLGANIGTTLIVQVLSFDVSQLAPILILVGVLMFRKGASQTADLGRVSIGLGLMVLALHQLLVLVTPYENAPGLRFVMGAISAQPIIAIVLAAALTWAAHSSVAIVLLVMSLAAKGVIPPVAAYALVLGANLGTAINPLVEGPSGDAATRRVPVGNLLNRLVGIAIALPLLPYIQPLLAAIEADPGRAVANFHTLFNIATALLFLPVLAPFSRLLRWLLPSHIDAADPSQPLYLDPAAKESPPVALAGAAREALRMVDALEAMLNGALEALDRGDRKAIPETRKSDDVLDRLNGAIKDYLTRLDPESLAEDDHRRVSEILSFTTNLEHAGDVVDRDLMGLAAKRLKRGLAFSPEGQAEIRTMMQRLTVNLRLAAAVFMTQDARAARRLAAEKEAFRELEARTNAAHFERLRAGRVETAETSSVHLDVIRDLKRINAHLVEAAAYPVLKEHGELLKSRLKLVR